MCTRVTRRRPPGAWRHGERTATQAAVGRPQPQSRSAAGWVCSHPPLESPEAGSGLPPTDEGRGAGAGPGAWAAALGPGRAVLGGAVILGVGAAAPGMETGSTASEGHGLASCPASVQGARDPGALRPESREKRVPAAACVILASQWPLCAAASEETEAVQGRPAPSSPAGGRLLPLFSLETRGAGRQEGIPWGGGLDNEPCVREARGTWTGTRFLAAPDRAPCSCPNNVALSPPNGRGRGIVGLEMGRPRASSLVTHRRLRALSEPSRSGSAARPRGGHASP